jgi:heme-degrading monooxygenase HmoA
MSMFAYLLKVRSLPDEQADQFFRRFKEVPGLLHTYDLQGIDDPEDAVVVAVWESREAAERYLNGAPLRKEVDQSIPGITRTMYEVRDSK